MAFCDHFLGANELAPPDEAALHAHYDGAIFFRKIGRLVADDAMAGAIDPFPRFNLVHIEAVQLTAERGC